MIDLKGGIVLTIALFFGVSGYTNGGIVQAIFAFLLVGLYSTFLLAMQSTSESRNGTYGGGFDIDYDSDGGWDGGD